MSQAKQTGTVIVVIGAAMIVAGLILIAVADPLVGGVILIVGASDVTVGALFRSGRLGPRSSGSEAEVASARAEQAAEDAANAAALGTTADGVPISGDTNPYARED